MKQNMPHKMFFKAQIMFQKSDFPFKMVLLDCQKVRYDAV